MTCRLEWLKTVTKMDQKVEEVGKKGEYQDAAMWQTAAVMKKKIEANGDSKWSLWGKSMILICLLHRSETAILFTQHLRRHQRCSKIPRYQGVNKASTRKQWDSEIKPKPEESSCTSLWVQKLSFADKRSRLGHWRQWNWLTSERQALTWTVY